MIPGYNGWVYKGVGPASAVPPKQINVVGRVKGSEQYVFIYDAASRNEMLRTLGRFAADPSLSFSWYDAAVVIQRIWQNRM